MKVRVYGFGLGKDDAIRKFNGDECEATDMTYVDAEYGAPVDRMFILVEAKNKKLYQVHRKQCRAIEYQEREI